MRALAGDALRGAVLSVVILAASVRPVYAGHYAWTTSGPLPGYVYQILIDPQDSTRIRATAGFFNPLLFLSSDRGQSWTQPPGLIFTGRLAADPSNETVLYTIGYFGAANGLLKSIDGGETWTGAGAGLPTIPFLALVAVSPSSPQTLYAVSSDALGPDSVFRSQDGGATWETRSGMLSLNNPSDLVVDPHDSNVLFMVTYDDVIKSVDGGASWQNTGLGIGASRVVIDPSNSERVFAGLYGSGVYASSDGGATWLPANLGIETGGVRDLALDPSHPDTLWVGTTSTGTDGGIYVTRNAHDWSRVDFGETVLIGTAVAIDPSDSEDVFVGAGHSPLIGHVFHSPDGGATWSHADAGVSGFSNGGVDAHVTDAAAAFSLSLGTVFQTEDSGAHWSLLADTGFALIDLAQSPSDPQTLYAGYVFPDFSGDGALKSVDGGATWNPATNGLAVNTLHHLAVSPSDSSRVLAASYDGLSQTVDGGGLWTPILATGNDVRTGAYDPLDASILYAGAYGSLQRSDDGGTTWATPAGLPPQAVNNWDVVAPVNDPDRVYLACGAGVYRSVDRGLDFAPASTGLPPSPGVNPIGLAADPSGSGRLYLLALLGAAVADAPAQGPQSNVFWTADGADSWRPLPGFLQPFGASNLSVSADGRTLYAATTSGTFQFERSFLDVPGDDPFWSRVDAAAMNGITAGCGGGKFCPDDSTLRSSVAVFLLRAKNGADYTPPPATGTVFGDVPVSLPAAPYIEELFLEGVTAGCGGGDYCPDQAVTRAEASVLLLKMEHGSDYQPPPATGTLFADVPADAFAAAWIEQLAREGVTVGCGGGRFCPDDPVSRAQSAAFVVLLFGLS